MHNKKIILFIFCSLLQACAQVDDYLLGKDNTPKPQALEPVNSPVKVAQNWSVPAGSSYKSHAQTKHRPALQGNILYTADNNGLVQAVDSGDTKVLWTLALNKEITSGPVVNYGVVALGTADANLILINQASGKLLWQSPVSGEILANPVITQNKIFVKTLQGNVYAFDKATGNRVWKAEHTSPDLVLKASSSPVVMGELLLVGFSDGKLDAFHVNTGALIWERSIAYASGSSDVERLVDIDADPIVQGNIVYLASYQGYLGALSLTDGQFIWRKPASIYKNMAIGDQALFVTDSEDVLWSIDKKNGQVNWKQTALKARGLTEPVLMDKHLIVGDKTGLLHVIALDTGGLQARSQLSGAIDAAPVVARDKLYVQTTNGMLNQLSVG
jgi:outer membrane protein assembly factor BamB